MAAGDLPGRRPHSSDPDEEGAPTDRPAGAQRTDAGDGNPDGDRIPEVGGGRDGETKVYGYLPGSERSGSSRETPKPAADDDDEEGDDPFAFIHEMEQEARERELRLKKRNLNVTEAMLLEELEAWTEAERRPSPHSKQVAVRLRREHYNRLRLVAQWSGVKPTTMARILICRGARAVIDEELRYRRQFKVDPD
jgi:hypothetical protein